MDQEIIVFLVLQGTRSAGSGNAITSLKLGFEGRFLVPAVLAGVLSVKEIAGGEVCARGWRCLLINVATPTFSFHLLGCSFG